MHQQELDFVRDPNLKVKWSNLFMSIWKLERRAYQVILRMSDENPVFHRKIFLLTEQSAKITPSTSIAFLQDLESQLREFIVDVCQNYHPKKNNSDLKKQISSLLETIKMLENEKEELEDQLGLSSLQLEHLADLCHEKDQFVNHLIGLNRGTTGHPGNLQGTTSSLCPSPPPTPHSNILYSQHQQKKPISPLHLDLKTL